MEPQLSNTKGRHVLTNKPTKVQSDSELQATIEQHTARSFTASVPQGSRIRQEGESTPSILLVNPKSEIMYSHGSITNKWRSLFLPVGLTRLLQHDMYVIGPSPCLSLVEVAVSSVWGELDGYEDIPDMPPVTIEVFVGDGKLFEFLDNAVQGIFRYGHGLGQYYRERYPKLQTWIEYFILLYDIRNIGQPDVRENFVRALVFLALSSMSLVDRVASKLQELDSDKVMLRLQRSLLDSSEILHMSSQIHLNRVSLIRHILVRVNGRRKQVQEEMLDLTYKGTQCLKVIGDLFVKRKGNTMSMDLDAIVPVLFASRMFAPFAINRVHLQIYARQFQQITSLVHNIPARWTENLPLYLSRDIQQFINGWTSVCDTINDSKHTKRLFLIWLCLMNHMNDAQDTSNRIYLGDIFNAAIRDGLEPRPEAQLAVNLLAMVCVYRVVGGGQPAHLSSVHALNYILRPERRELPVSNMMDEIASSFCRVLSFKSPFQNLKVVGFIKPFVTQFGAEDRHADAYWWERVSQMASHDAALRTLDKYTYSS